MKLIYVLLISAAFLQSTVWPINLSLLILLILGFFSATFSKKLLWGAFLAGILVDFLSLTPLGTHSLGFLIVLSLIILCRLLFDSRSLGLAFPLVIIFLFIFKVIEGLLLRQRPILFDVSLALEAVITILLYFPLRRWESFLRDRETQQLSLWSKK